ncbi:VCBS repeat-containing protein [Rhodohalobacter sp. 614A]|uniref:VCBS repeat-containing protein n=1 Tax=Rhodohalobacter sp. 614A TaxID=2908649 RepID=UPI001F443C9A|nr:VCBS repeat-containing protein [Rhodohalobacter sp. 614A]
MKRVLSLFLFVTALFLFINSCGRKTDKKFELLDSENTGIDFVNQLTPSTELNIFNYLYFYDGAGLAAGDLNGNGFPDLFFASNQGKNILYLNEGNFTFRDVTEQAFQTQRNWWTTGVTFVDINNDGRLDIYVSNVGGILNFDGHSELFINLGNNEEGVPQFEERAAEYGLDLQGLATQAAFFDYDLDGDLDMYMMNHSVHSLGTFNYSTLREESHPFAGDRLMRNDDHTFTDVTEKSGIYNSALGYGLGIGISDLNQDGWPDIYIGNDFHEDDYLYINNQDGTFTESLGEMIRHTSYSSMGNDLVDFNNDGLVDIISLDMLPEDYEKLKASAAEDPLEIFNTKLSYGYKYQFTRNTLQLNRGAGKFSEIGMLAGVYATDWSWAALGADFDNNGFNDLFISNGIYGRTNDLDYITYITQDDIQEKLAGELSEDDVRLAERAPAVKIPNYMYSNNGSLVFEDVSESWGLNQNTFSSGAVFADLDNDGALDLVTNNVNQPASVYRNRSRELGEKSSRFLKVKLNGPQKNRYGIGTKVSIHREAERGVLIRELYPVRGFQSSVEPILHFGLDSLQTISEMIVEWPDGKSQVLQNISTNQTLEIDYANASEIYQEGSVSESDQGQAFFEEITEQLNISYKHEENDFIEFNRETLIPHMVSREGPAIAVADVNGDGLDDFFAGGAKRQPASLYIQQDNGTFQQKNISAFEEDFIQEDVDAKFADFTGDGHTDLLVVSGGNEYSGSSEYMPPRLYLNDGKGNFIRDNERLPDLYITGSVAAVSDVNQDGLPDLFIGARAVPWNYGHRPESYLLINRGEGFFRIDTTEFGKQFSDLGLVTGAVWSDMDLDGKPDLVISSEWESIKIVFGDQDKRIQELRGSSGLWNTVVVRDLNHDGWPDILAGNLGLNSKFKASSDKPLRMYVNDYDNNGIIEQIVTYVDKNGRERLFATKDELEEQLPYIRERFEGYQAFAEADLYDVLDQDLLNQSIQYEAEELHSVVFMNNENGFIKKALPIEVQFSPVYDFFIHDLNSDGSEDVISVGNFLNANIQRGRYDAGYGSILFNDGNGNLDHIPNREADWFLNGQIRRAEMIRIGNSKVLITAENDGILRFFKINSL